MHCGIRDMDIACWRVGEYTEREREEGREEGEGAFDMLQEIEIIDSNAESVGKKRAAQVTGE